MITNIPVDKECSICLQRKLLTDFEPVNVTEDKRVFICKSCVETKQKMNPDFGCGGPPHTDRCMMDKILAIMYNELDLFLSRVQNGLSVPDDIKEIMQEIIRQDEANQRGE